MKYEWLKLEDYASFKKLTEAITVIIHSESWFERLKENLGLYS